MTSTARPHRSRGFTLLEVLCAFAILAGLTGMLTVIFVGNVERGTDALSRRELREAADTIFRKMIYETEEYRDGDERTLDEEYGEFARLKGWQRDRWAIYRYHLEKKLTNVVGQSQEADESLFGEAVPGRTGATDDTSGTSSGSSSSTSTTEGDGTQPGIELMKMTLRIYRTEEELNDQPLLTLVTWYDPDRGQVQRGGAPSR